MMVLAAGNDVVEPEAGHLVPVEAPGAVAEAVGAFRGQILGRTWMPARSYAP